MLSRIHTQWIIYFGLVLSLTACYRMPTDEDYCVVPTTNNPAVTCEKPSGPMPQLSY